MVFAFQQRGITLSPLTFPKLNALVDGSFDARTRNSPMTKPEAASTKLFRVGTLTYTSATLRKVFFWLLAGDVVYMLAEYVEPRLLPIILKGHGATDKQIAIIVSSITAIMQCLVMPVVCYRSDRTRSRWGRRIPFIFWTTPILSLLLAITPFAPEIATWATSNAAVGAWVATLPVSPVILSFGVLVVAYRFFQSAAATMFFCLFKDVVPASHMGRFLALFRMFGAVSLFIINYWLIGMAVEHAKPIFIGISLLNLLGFLGLCRYVKEGDYPPIEEKYDDSAMNRWPLLKACRTFVVESYSEPIYLWTYFVRLLIYASIPVSGFLIFFPQEELGIPIDRAGKLMSWASVIWLLVAYPFGKLVDRWGALRVLKLGLAVSAIGYAASFFFVVGEKTFFVSSMVTGVMFWVTMLSQTALAQEILSPARFGQLSSANVLVQSIVIALITSPLSGAILDGLKASGFSFTMPVPFVGGVRMGTYRTVNLMLAGFYGLAWLGLLQVHRHWLRHGGSEDNYKPPL